jgi:berberine-like enzyme
MAACYAGPVADGEQAIVDLGRMGDALANQLSPILTSRGSRRRMRHVQPSANARSVRIASPSSWTDSSMRLSSILQRAPQSTRSASWSTATGRSPVSRADATAFALRRNPYHFEIIAFWDDAARTTVNLEWADRFLAATLPFSTGEVYVNSLDEGETHRIREAYGVNYERLRRIKREYNPTNFFRFNQNIPPSSD